jgi:thymidylate kinase
VVSDGPLDVLARLAEHQSNLKAAPAPHDGALLALPLPAIARALAREPLAAWRDAALKRAASLSGGGDGPLPIVDLDQDTRPLPILLRELADRYGALVVWGARDQPGFAREVRGRWRGGLQLLEEGVTVALMDDPRPVLDFGQGVVRIYAGSPPPAGAATVIVGVPEWADSGAIDGRAYVVDPQRRLGCWSGFLPPEAVLGTDRGAALREAWLRRWVGQRDAVRCAVLELDPLLESRLRRPHAKPIAEGRVIAVTGIDGSGKTTHVTELAGRLSAAGHRVATLKMYRHGAFLDLADEISARTRQGAPLSALRISRLVKLVDSLRVYLDCFRPALERADVVVMDRYVETHIAAARSQLGWDVAEHPLLLFPPPAVQFWLRLDPGLAIDRLKERSGDLTADEHSAGLTGYARVFAELAVNATDVVLDARAPREANMKAVAGRALACAPRPASRTGAIVEVEGVEAPGRVRRPGERRAVRIGGARGALLGNDVLRFREALGERAPMLTTLDWLEIYATQVLLDLDLAAAAATEADMTVPLWPGALAALPGFADCRGLEEIDRMIRAGVEVRGVATDSTDRPAADLLRRLAPGVPLADYEDALRRVAAERGWTIL